MQPIWPPPRSLSEFLNDFNRRRTRSLNDVTDQSRSRDRGDAQSAPGWEAHAMGTQ
jgi:hypothetical protein